MINNLFEFIKTYNSSFAIIISIITLIFSFYSFYKNSKISKSKNILLTSEDLLINFLSPLRYSLYENINISSNKSIHEFFIHKSYLIDNHIYILVNEIFILENTPNSSQEKLNKSKELLKKLVDSRYMFYKHFHNNELIDISAKALLPNKIKTIFTILDCISLIGVSFFIFIIFFIIYNNSNDSGYFIAMTLTVCMFISVIWIIFRLVFYPRKILEIKQSTFLSFYNYYFVSSITPFDGEYYCPICKTNFHSYKGLILECPSKNFKCSFINFIKFKNK